MIARPIITPEMKVSALLAEFPELADTLFEIAPAFARLRHPMLRRTVAKATSLRQAAKVADVELSLLINRLREAAGQTTGFETMSEGVTAATAPAWANTEYVKQTFDARPQIERGEQPMSLVMSDLKKLVDAEVFELITPFAPAPLVDLAVKQGFEVWSTPAEAGAVRTYFRRTLR